MKKFLQKVMCALAPALLAVSAQAQTNFNPTVYLQVSVTPNQYDNLVLGYQFFDGVHSNYSGIGLAGASPSWTLGGNPSSFYTNDFYIGFHGTNGSLEVKTGVLTLDVDDFKLGFTEVTGDEGDLTLDAGTTVNVNAVGRLSPGLARNGNDLAQVTVNSGATLNFDVAGTTEQRWDLGNGGLGTLTINGGAVNVALGTATISDTTSELTIGNGANARGTINLNSGTFTNSMPLPTTLGGTYTGLPTGTVGSLGLGSYTGTLTSNATAFASINISNGTFAVTATYPPISGTLPNNEAAFGVGTGYVNFIVGGNGALALANWTSADYQALVSAGQIVVGGAPSAFGNFAFSVNNGMGVLQLAPLAISGPVINTAEYGFSTNSVSAGEAVVLVCQVHDSLGTASYQWQAYNPATGFYTNIVGSNTTSLTLNTLALYNAANYAPSYQLVATDAAHTLSTTSAIASIFINPGLSPQLISDITPDAQPDNPVVGSTFTYTVSFNGDLPISYQWQKSVSGAGNWNNISGATNPTLRLNNISASSDSYYRVFVTNVLGTTYSSVASLVAVTSNEKFIWSPPLSMVGLSADQILNSFASTDYVAGAMWAGTTASNVYLTNGSVITFSPLQSCFQVTGGNGSGPGAGLNTNSFGGNLSFSNLLGSYNYYDAAHHFIFMSNLVPGEQYIIQLFSLEDRNQYATRSYATPQNGTTSWQDPNNAADISEAYLEIGNQYMVGLMYASNTTEDVEQNLPNTYGNFNAVVVRSTATIPPPYWASVLPAAPQPVYAGNNSTVVFQGTNVTTDMTIPNTTISYQWQSGPPGGPYTNLPVSQLSKWSGTTSTNLTVFDVGVSDNLYYVLLVGNGYATLTNVYPFAVFPPPAAPTTAYAAAVVNDHPYAFWQLSETSDFSAGGVTAYDLSGHGYFPGYGVASQGEFNGIDAPQAPIFPGFANNQGALQTTANTPTSVVSVPNLNLNTNTVTIAMWIFPNGNQSAASGLFMNRSSSDAAGLSFANTVSNGQAQLGYVWDQNSAATYNWNSGLFPIPNQWSFVALVISPTQAKEYLYYQDPLSLGWDLGQAINAVTNDNEAFNTGITSIGGDPSQNANRTFNGIISDVSVFTSALSDAQILQLFAAGNNVSTYPPFVSIQPVAYQNIYSGSTLQLNATLGGSTLFTNQWTLNGAAISGATNSTLTVSNLTLANGGSYQLLSTNQYGNTASSVAAVNVITAPAATLVGHWLSGAQNLAETSGFKPAGTHDGFFVSSSTTVTNFVWTNDVPANATGGSSLHLNGAGFAISNSSAGSFATDPSYQTTFDDVITNSFTVMCWAKGFPGAWNSWVSKWGESPPEEGWQLRVDGSRNNGNSFSCFTVRNSSVGTVTLGAAAFGNSDDMGGSIASDDGLWHHYAGTFDAVYGTRNLYVDGVLSGSETGNHVYIEAPNAHLVMGAKDGSGGDSFQSFNGGITLYDVRIYSYEAPVSDIRTIARLSPPPISVQARPAIGSANGGVVLNWTYGSLYQATNITGPWTKIVGATPPYTNAVTSAPEQFFRIGNP